MHLEKLKKVEVLLTKEIELDIEKEIKSNLGKTKELFNTNIKESSIANFSTPSTIKT